MRCFFSSLCAITIVGSLAAAAEPGWPGWLGPNRDGKSLETGLLKQWPEGGPKLLWKIDGLGSGFSSPAVAEGKVYISGDVDGKLMIFALDMDGKQLWKKEFGKGRGGPDGARSSPVIDGGNLYLLNGNGPIGCFDAATGDQKWSREAKEFGGKPGGWGYAESVLIDKNMAVFKPGGKNCIVALDKTNGQTIWESSGFDAGPEYGSCLLVTFEGRPIILTGSNRGLVAVDATDGKMLWSNDFSAHNTANCPTPAYQDGYVFWANGYGKGGICMKLKMEDGKVAADVAWKTRDMDCQHGGYIIHKGFIYGNNGGGWACLDLKTGKKQWPEKGQEASAKAVGKGSLCFADGMLYLFSEKKGKAGLAACSPEGLQLEGTFNVEGKGPSWAHPVVAGGRLYLRYDENLYCFDVKAASSPPGSSRAAAPRVSKAVVHLAHTSADEVAAPVTSVSGASVIKGAKVEFVAPVLGTKSPITGKVTGLAPMTNYQVAVLVSNDRKIWWDKTHNVHGVPIKEDGTFTISGWVVDPHDLTVKNIGIWVVPSTFGAVHAEGAPLPEKLVQASVTALVKSREADPEASRGAEPAKAVPKSPAKAASTSAAAAGLPAGYTGKPFQDSVYKAGAQVIPGKVQCTYFDMGGEGVAFHSDGLNHGSHDSERPRPAASPYIQQFRGEEEVSISYASEKHGDHALLTSQIPFTLETNQLYIGWTLDGQWLNYTVNVKKAGTYKVNILYASKPTTFKLLVNRKPAGDYKLPVNTGSVHAWNLANVGTITFPEAGLQLLTFEYSRGNNLAYLDFEPVDETAAPVTGAGLIKGVKVDFVAPLLGTKSPITGKVTGLAPIANYQIAVLVSRDRKKWWDKTHNVHGVPIKEDGTFKISGWAFDPHTLTTPYIGIWVVPSNFGAVHAEGAPLPKKLVEAAVTALVKSREAGPGAATGADPAKAVPTAPAKAEASAATASATATIPAAASSANAKIPADYTGKPYGGKAREIPGIIQAEDYDVAPDNMNDVTFHYNGGGPNNGSGDQPDRGGRKGDYRTTDDSIGIIKFGGGHVSITGEEEDPDQFYLGSTHDGEWMKYTVRVAKAGTYRFGGKFAATGKESKLSVTFTPTLKIGPVSIPTTAGFQPDVETYHVWRISDNLGEVTLPAGKYVMQVTLEKSGERRGGANLDYFTFIRKP